MTEYETIPRCPPIWFGFILAALCLIEEVGESIAIPLPNLGAQIDHTILILALSSVALVFWFFCVARIHRIVYEASSGRYSTLPFEAIGFHLVPVFNLYWMVKWPIQIARYVNEHRPPHRISGSLAGLSLLCALPIVVVSKSTTIAILFGVILYLWVGISWTIKADALNFYRNGVAKYRRGDYGAAKSALDKAIMLGIRFVDVFNYRGLTRQLGGDPASAIRDFDIAIKLDAQHCQAYYNRGLAKSKVGSYAGAIPDFDEAIRLNPKHAEAYYSRGVAEFNLREYDWAIIDFGQAIKRKPAFADAYYHRGLAKEKHGDYSGAVADFEEASKIDPKYATKVHKDTLPEQDEIYRGTFEKGRSDSRNRKAFDPKRASDEEKEKYYGDVLRLQGKVTIKNINQAYKTLIAKCHPNKVQQLDEDIQSLADQKAKAINEAFEYFRIKYSF
jgi:tetratricopeptide (TPR) repeat protein